MGAILETPGPPRLAGDAPRGRLVAIVGRSQQTNCLLAEEWSRRGILAATVPPHDATKLLVGGDTAVGRVDVLTTLDGIEDGLDELDALGRRRVRVLNSAAALAFAHDKLLTAERLVAARIPHPVTVHLASAGARLALQPPLVLKPRFGSWGADVFLCRNENEVEAVLDAIRDRSWFRRHGALLQEYIPSERRDLRLLVAGGRIVGAVQRVAQPGEWRTNVARGARRVPIDPSPEACRLAIAAAASIGADFVGVDLLPVEDGYVVLEINGAVEFDAIYDLPGRDVYSDLADALSLPRTAGVTAR